MKKSILTLFAVAIMLSACQQQLPEADYNVISLPKEVQLNEEQPFVLKQETKVYYETGLQREAQFLNEYVNDLLGFGLNLQEAQGVETDGIMLKQAPTEFDKADAYEINITPKQVIIKGADAAGVFYGVQTLRKSLPIT